MIYRKYIFTLIFFVAVISFLLGFFISLSFAAKPLKHQDDFIRGLAEAPFSKSNSAFLCYEKDHMRLALQKKFFPFESFCIFFTSERR